MKFMGGFFVVGVGGVIPFLIPAISCKNLLDIVFSLATAQLQLLQSVASGLIFRFFPISIVIATYFYFILRYNHTS
jgi:hypothetical protein